MAQYQQEESIFIEPQDIPPATPGAVASKFDDSVAIGIDLPMVLGGANGFKQNFSVLKQAKANLINLLLTRKGERINHPSFGSNLWRILFEPNTPEILKEDIEQSITDAVDNWLPYILIREIIISESPDDIDRNILKMNISFSIRDDIENIDEVIISVNETFGLVNSNGENQT